VVKYLTPPERSIDVGVVVSDVEGRPCLDIYVKSTGVTSPWVVTELTDGLFVQKERGPIIGVSDLITVEPAGIVYPRILLEGTAEIQALQEFSQRNDNPHAVTKAQVGLGSVDNYGTASTAMAITGTATDKFMTPASTTAKVNDSIGILCDELILVMDDAMANLFS